MVMILRRDKKRETTKGINKRGKNKRREEKGYTKKDVKKKTRTVKSRKEEKEARFVVENTNKIG